MTVRIIYTLAAVASLGLASFTYAATKSAAPLPADNQQLADDVAMQLRQSGVATGARFSVSVQNGVVELIGQVRSDKQRELVTKQVMAVPGVAKVAASLKVVASDVSSRPETAEAKPPKSVKPVVADQIRRASYEALPMGNAPVMGPSSISMAPPPPIGPAPGMPAPMMSQEPVPLAAPSQPAYDMAGPKLPPYAWPTYAPYPNYSRVAYPQAYPYNAFPFIGPFYPFPKVPLGWRSVKLEWDDGHWYLGRLSTPHDYWRVKFW